MATIQSQSTSNPSSIAQAAALAALDGPMDFLASRNDTFRQRRDLCLDSFNATPGLSCRRPEGAFYLFPSCAGLIGRKVPDGSVLQSDLEEGSLTKMRELSEQQTMQLEVVREQLAVRATEAALIRREVELRGEQIRVLEKSLKEAKQAADPRVGVAVRKGRGRKSASSAQSAETVPPVPRPTEG